ncbi:hypothetical protein ACQY0O_008005 [Thecaphora frezii]
MAPPYPVKPHHGGHMEARPSGPSHLHLAARSPTSGLPGYAAYHTALPIGYARHPSVQPYAQLRPQPPLAPEAALHHVATHPRASHPAVSPGIFANGQPTYSRDQRWNQPYYHQPPVAVASPAQSFGGLTSLAPVTVGRTGRAQQRAGMVQPSRRTNGPSRHDIEFMKLKSSSRAQPALPATKQEHDADHAAEHAGAEDPARAVPRQMSLDGGVPEHHSLGFDSSDEGGAPPEPRPKAEDSYLGPPLPPAQSTVGPCSSYESALASSSRDVPLAASPSDAGEMACASTSTAEREPIRLHDWHIVTKFLCDTGMVQEAILRETGLPPQRVGDLSYWITISGKRRDVDTGATTKQNQGMTWQTSLITKGAAANPTDGDMWRVTTTNGTVYELFGGQDVGESETRFQTKRRQLLRRIGLDASDADANSSDARDKVLEAWRAAVVHQFEEGWHGRVAEALLGLSDELRSLAPPSQTKRKRPRVNFAAVADVDSDAPAEDGDTSLEASLSAQVAMRQHAKRTRTAEPAAGGNGAERMIEDQVPHGAPPLGCDGSDAHHGGGSGQRLSPNDGGANALDDEAPVLRAQSRGQAGDVGGVGEKGRQTGTGIGKGTEKGTGKGKGKGKESAKGKVKAAVKASAGRHKVVEGGGENDDIELLWTRVVSSPALQVSVELPYRTTLTATRAIKTEGGSNRVSVRSKGDVITSSPKASSPRPVPTSPARADRSTEIATSPGAAVATRTTATSTPIRIKSEADTGLPPLLGSSGKLSRELMRLMSGPFGVDPAARRGFMQGCSADNPIVLDPEGSNDAASASQPTSSRCSEPLSTATTMTARRDSDATGARPQDALEDSSLLVSSLTAAVRQASARPSRAAARVGSRGVLEYWRYNPITSPLATYRQEGGEQRRQSKMFRAAAEKSRLSRIRTASDGKQDNGAAAPSWAPAAETATNATNTTSGNNDSTKDLGTSAEATLAKSVAAISTGSKGETRAPADKEAPRRPTRKAAKAPDSYSVRKLMRAQRQKPPRPITGVVKRKVKVQPVKSAASKKGVATVSASKISVTTESRSTALKPGLESAAVSKLPREGTGDKSKTGKTGKTGKMGKTGKTGKTGKKVKAPAPSANEAEWEDVSMDADAPSTTAADGHPGLLGRRYEGDEDDESGSGLFARFATITGDARDESIAALGFGVAGDDYCFSD